jgi:CheY-like chemotaxis protein/HPt (histidine-containing phosphotransfer) domain-containing protein
MVGVTTESQSEQTVTLRIAVCDTGIGISAHTQPHLFQAFVQADGSTSRQYGGTGLGLAICKKLVELMGGSIGVESESGRGSTFWFTVRLEKDRRPAGAKRLDAADLRGVRLLVIDDSQSSRTELVAHAVAWGLAVGEADSGRQALELLRAAAAADVPYGLAILSLANPEMDGMTLARTVKTDPSIASVKLLLIPRAGVRGQALAAREAGIVGYLPRPIQASELLHCLTTMIGDATGASAGDAGVLFTRHNLGEQSKVALRHRILVTDDNPVSQDVTKLQIEKLGYQGDTASNGLEAVEAAGRTSYALILMDCQMPVMDGFAATAEIRRREAGNTHVPIVAFTANVVPGEQARCLEVGMDGFVGKPIKKAELLEILARHLSRSPAAQRGPASEAADVYASPVQIVDEAMLLQLQEELGAELLRQTIERYLEDAAGSVEQVEQAITGGRLGDAKRAVHRLKGGSSTLGFLRMADVCATLEDHADRMTEVERAQAVEQLRAACTELRRWNAKRRTSQMS